MQVGLRVCSGVGGLGAGICAPPLPLPGAAGFGLEQTCSEVYVDKTVHGFLRHADLAGRSAGLQVF